MEEIKCYKCGKINKYYVKKERRYCSEPDCVALLEYNDMESCLLGVNTRDVAFFQMLGIEGSDE